jgi:signal transduction histidine kinase
MTLSGGVPRNESSSGLPAEWAHKLTAMTAMAIGISHDMSNCLTVIRGNNAIIQRSLPADSRAIENSHMLDEAAVQALDLAQSLYVFSGNEVRDVEEVNISSLVGRIGADIKARVPQAVSVHFRMDASMPTVRGDPAMITHAVLDLVDNAAEAMMGGAGSITIGTGVRECTETELAACYRDHLPPAGRYGFVEVVDTGCGISPEVRDRMFEPFFTTKIRAHGMGLPYVLGVARSHKGAILIDSAPGKGTTVRLYLPCRLNDEP